MSSGNDAVFVFSVISLNAAMTLHNPINLAKEWALLFSLSGIWLLLSILSLRQEARSAFLILQCGLWRSKAVDMQSGEKRAPD